MNKIWIPHPVASKILYNFPPSYLSIPICANLPHSGCSAFSFILLIHLALGLELTSFIIQQILLSIYYMPSTVLGPGERAVNKTDKIPCPCEATDIPVEWPSPTLGGANPSVLGPGLAGARLKQEGVVSWRQKGQTGGDLRGNQPRDKEGLTKVPRISTWRLKEWNYQNSVTGWRKTWRFPTLAANVMGTRHKCIDRVQTILLWLGLISVLRVPPMRPRRYQ